MDIGILFFLVSFSAGIGFWADSWGRNGWAWALAALIISPLISAVILLIAGKTIEKKAEEAAMINSINNK